MEQRISCFRQARAVSFTRWMTRRSFGGRYEWDEEGCNVKWAGCAELLVGGVFWLAVFHRGHRSLS